MNLENLKKAIQNENLELLSKKVGYSNQAKFEKSLNTLLESDSIHSFFYKGHYDLLYTAQDFFSHLALALGFDKEEVNQVLASFGDYEKEIEKFKDAYIFVNTNFKRKSQPIFALAALESKRRLSLFDLEILLYKNRDELIEIFRGMVKNHYKKTKGKLHTWGDIADYQIHLQDEVIILDPEGNVLDKEPAFSGGASTSIK